jgi:hypothetical protein
MHVSITSKKSTWKHDYFANLRTMCLTSITDINNTLWKNEPKHHSQVNEMVHIKMLAYAYAWKFCLLILRSLRWWRIRRLFGLQSINVVLQQQTSNIHMIFRCLHRCNNCLKLDTRAISLLKRFWVRTSLFALQFAEVRLGSYNPSLDPTLCGSFYALGLSFRVWR